LRHPALPAQQRMLVLRSMPYAEIRCSPDVKCNGATYTRCRVRTPPDLLLPSQRRSGPQSLAFAPYWRLCRAQHAEPLVLENGRRDGWRGRPPGGVIRHTAHCTFTHTQCLYITSLLFYPLRWPDPYPLVCQHISAGIERCCYKGIDSGRNGIAEFAWWFCRCPVCCQPSGRTFMHAARASDINGHSGKLSLLSMFVLDRVSTRPCAVSCRSITP
jgi:hypothetical protein